MAGTEKSDVDAKENLSKPTVSTSTLSTLDKTCNTENWNEENEDSRFDLAATFRGVAAATRKLLPAGQKAVRAVGQNRPLAFASEGAVAGHSMLPKFVYYGAWTLSGAAITADITTKYWDAPTDKKFETVLYWTSFHIPASLVVPAYIIHQVVHTVEKSVERSQHSKTLPPRLKALAPVGAALLSIIPVVPIVDLVAEMTMEPTLGAYLGLNFPHHTHKEVSSGGTPTK